MLNVTNLTKKFNSPSGDVNVLKDINMSINDGEFISIIGKSGSGKSTLLSILGALDAPTSGKITVDDLDITKLSAKKQTTYRAKKIGFVFQQYNLIPNLTAIENVMLALEFNGVPVKHRKERAQELLGEVGIEPEQQIRKPSKLSGGQQQRVSIARALANNPAYVLADEPTGNLDEETGKKIFQLLHKLVKTENTTVIVVTHDMDIAGKTDKTFLIKDGKITTFKI